VIDFDVASIRSNRTRRLGAGLVQWRRPFFGPPDFSPPPQARGRVRAQSAPTERLAPTGTSAHDDCRLPRGPFYLGQHDARDV